MKSCLLFILSLIVSISVYADKLDVEMKEEGTSVGGRSITIVPIKADINYGKNIEAVFIYDLNTINVIIENEIGSVVYEASVNTTVKKNLNIDITELYAGAYKLLFKGSNGGTYYADFVVY